MPTSQFKVDQGATVSATALSNNGTVVVGGNADFIVLTIRSISAPSRLMAVNSTSAAYSATAPLRSIEAAGTLSTTTGLSNNGKSIQFTGQASVIGVMNNLSSGVMELSGQQSHTFFGGFNNDGT